MFSYRGGETLKLEALEVQMSISNTLAEILEETAYRLSE